MNSLWWLDNALYISIGCFFVASIGIVYLLIVLIKKEK